jgi:hypothetical protein
MPRGRRSTRGPAADRARDTSLLSDLTIIISRRPRQAVNRTSAGCGPTIAHLGFRGRGHAPLIPFAASSWRMRPWRPRASPPVGAIESAASAPSGTRCGFSSDERAAKTRAQAT